MEEAKPTLDHRKLFRHRLYAFTFDMFMIGLTSKLVMFTYTSFMRAYFYQLRPHVQESLIANLSVVHFSVLITVFFTYHFVSFYTSEGKTLGKMMFGLRVYSPTQPRMALSMSESYKRTLGYTVCYVTGFVLFALPLLRQDRRGLPDFFSATEVTFEDYFNQHLLNATERADLEKDQLDLFNQAA